MAKLIYITRERLEKLTSLERFNSLYISRSGNDLVWGATPYDSIPAATVSAPRWEAAIKAPMEQADREGYQTVFVVQE